MEWAWIVGAVVALSIATLNLGASIAVVRSKRSGSLQKVGRLAVIWLLPLLGSMFVLHRMQETEPGVVPREIVAASGIGWGLLEASCKDAGGEARGNRRPAGGSGDDSGGDGGDDTGGGDP